MIRVTTLYAGTAGATARYYTKYLTKADGEEPGVWLGGQAAKLGLSGEVATEALELLLSGRDPTTRAQLGYPLIDRTLSNGKVIRAVAGFDATVSAPKSLSVWWALTGDARLAEAHDVAVGAVVHYLERFGATTRIRSNGGRLHPDTNGLTIAAFRQTTSRLDDPQLHTHLVISSKVRTVDGAWLALDARLLKRHQRALGGLYQSVLRAELTHRFGVAFEAIDKGQAEIAGVPQELLARFSKRTAEIDTALAVKIAEFYQREGRDPTRFERAALGREAAADTRQHKTGHDLTDLRARWLQEAAAVGVTPETLTASITEAGRHPIPPVAVTSGEVIEELSTRSSAWHRMDVLRTVCDLQRPLPHIPGTRWAQLLDQAVDQVLAQCIDLDPKLAGNARTRTSDGRSIWIEPVAAHVTSEAVLAQEEHILTWAIEHHPDQPAPSTTINRTGLDLLQADAAAAVAGADRLVLIVGPAGTGKTTMLRAAVTDLHTVHHPVFGLAPTAKAARVLERETGMLSDTVAKLLWEHSRPDRGPERAWDLGPGTTVIVDEAGMLNTFDLYTLTRLADRNDWRLALIGDPRQLQAVGRGGMFHELCATGNTIQLERIHRFTNAWEAAASLKLRHGDISAFDAYQGHGRIIPGTLHEHLHTAARLWMQQHAAGTTTAVTTTTNEHVEALNNTIQQHRLQHGQLNPNMCVEIAEGAHAHPGDIIATRRNDRHLRTSTGDTVRNRELWTITNLSVTGELTVTQLDGHATVTLPAGYVRDHVRLGYAATEPGNQSGTEGASITLATAATTGRGLYVAVTRGHDNNVILTVTETHDIREARDLLEQIVFSDRADIPATTVRRQLAQQHRQPPPPRYQARCTVPDWWADLRDEVTVAWRAANQAFQQYETEQARKAQTISDAVQRLDIAERAYQPFAADVKQATNRFDVARHNEYVARQHLDTAGFFARKQARADLRTAHDRVEAAEASLAEVKAVAEPARREVAHAAKDLSELRSNHRTQRILDEWISPPRQLETITQRLEALDGWHHWATGKPTTPEQAFNIIDSLHTDHRDPDRAAYKALADVVQQWAHTHHIQRPQPTINHSIEIESYGIDIGL